MEFEEFSRIIADVLGIDADTITADSKFIDDLGADSLDLFQIVTDVEDALDIQIPEEMLEQIVTVEDALNAVNENI